MREFRLVWIHLAGAPFVDHALAVSHQNVLARNAESHVMLGGRYRGCSGSGEYDPHLLDLLADDLECVEERSSRDYGGSVLVIVEDRNAHRLAQGLLDVETVGSADVLEIDSPDRRLQELAELDDIVGILRAHETPEHLVCRLLLEK